MARVAIEPGLLALPTGDEAPQLLGSRCDACKAVFHPPRQVCLACYGRALSDVALDGRGAVYACTQVGSKLRPGQRATRDYWVAQIDLDAGPRVQGILAADFAEPKIGVRVSLGLETLRTDDQGNEIVVHNFRREERPR